MTTPTKCATCNNLLMGFETGPRCNACLDRAIAARHLANMPHEYGRFSSRDLPACNCADVAAQCQRCAELEYQADAIEAQS